MALAIDLTGRVVLVTGGQRGIGRGISEAFILAGADVVTCGRSDVDDPLPGTTHLTCDVRDADAVQALVDEIVATYGRLDVLVNNAGGALGLAPLAEADDDHWRGMWETNVLGLMFVTRALLPKLEASGDGHIVNIGSIAGFETYPGGAGYTSVKHGVRAITRTLRIELLGKPVRITEINPGLVETEFSIVRLGSEERAAKVYEGMTPLTGDDIADCIVWAVTRPPHVNIDEMVVRPVAQATARDVARNAGL